MRFFPQPPDRAPWTDGGGYSIDSADLCRLYPNRARAPARRPSAARDASRTRSAEGPAGRPRESAREPH